MVVTLKNRRARRNEDACCLKSHTRARQLMVTSALDEADISVQCATTSQAPQSSVLRVCVTAGADARGGPSWPQATALVTGDLRHHRRLLMLWLPASCLAASKTLSNP